MVFDGKMIRPLTYSKNFENILTNIGYVPAIDLIQKSIFDLKSHNKFDFFWKKNFVSRDA